MPFVGSIIPASVVGLARQVKQARRKRDEVEEELAADAARRGADEAELAAPSEVGSVEASERVPANESELSREDHEAILLQGGYTAHGARGSARRRHIDLEG